MAPPKWKGGGSSQVVLMVRGEMAFAENEVGAAVGTVGYMIVETMQCHYYNKMKKTHHLD